MFEIWLANFKMLVGDDEEELPPLAELRRLFEGGRSEWEAWSEIASVPVCNESIEA
jgi:hypothetical protein